MRAMPSMAALAWCVPIITEAMALGRSMIFAWLIGPEELGKAILLAIILRLVEMLSDLGAERMLAQATDGDAPELQSTLHGVLVLRGAVVACVLIAIALPVSTLFDQGPSLAAYASLAFIPLVRSFLHLDFRRAERRFNYRPLAIVEGGASLAMLLAACFAAFDGDHRAIIVAFTAQCVAQVALSHLVANRSYEISFSLPGISRAWRLGGPLIMNAALMFLALQADKLIVAMNFSWTDVSVYGVAFQLALLPALVVGRASASLLIPQFRMALERGELRPSGLRALQIHAFLAVLFFIVYVIAAQTAISIFYGPVYEPDVALVLALASVAAIRILRTPFSYLSFVQERTGDIVRANIWRGLAVIPAAGAATLAGPLAAIAWAGAVGEVLAGTAAFIKLTKPGGGLEPPSPKEVRL